ncbi:unnamed protein product, partial [Discosporangium mesarthrocarpum]
LLGVDLSSIADIELDDVEFENLDLDMDLGSISGAQDRVKEVSGARMEGLDEPWFEMTSREEEKGEEGEEHMEEENEPGVDAGLVEGEVKGGESESQYEEEEVGVDLQEEWEEGG